MKKFFILSLIFLSSMFFAQTANAGRFGVKAGVNVSSLNFKNGLPGALGYSAGITWQWNLPLGFAIQPDLLYHVKATRLSDITKDTFRMGYVELPVNIQWGLRFAQKNVRLFAQASPFVGYAVNQTGGTSTAATGNTAVDGNISSNAGDKWNNINRFSYGAGLGLGVQLWALQVTAMYNWNFGKLSNIKNAAWSDFNEGNFGGCTITLALMFGGKKK